MYGLLYECKFLTIEETNKKKKKKKKKGINSGHHYLPTYQILMISDNVEFLRYYGGHFENGDRKKFFNVRNHFGTSLSTHITNLDGIGQC